MTLSHAETSAGPPTSTSTATASRDRWKRRAGTVAVLGLLAAVSVVAWIWRHPTAFPEVTSEVSTSSNRWPVDEAIFVAVTFPFTRGEEPVTIHAAEANLVENTADATVSFGVCTSKPKAGGISSSREQDLSDLCASWLPLDELRLTSDPEPRRQLLMKVTPRQPGTVRIAGAAVTYSQGWQRGTQDIGEHLRLQAR